MFKPPVQLYIFSTDRSGAMVLIVFDICFVVTSRRAFIFSVLFLCTVNYVFMLGLWRQAAGHFLVFDSYVTTALCWLCSV